MKRVVRTYGKPVVEKMNLRNKKRMAAEILKVGVRRVRIDPTSMDQLEDAITRDNIRALIHEGIIWVEPSRGISRGRARVRAISRKKRGRGSGSKKGSSGSRQARKTVWVNRVRAMRKYLKMVKDRGDITGEAYKRLYRQVRGGQMRSLRHLKEQVKQLTQARW